MSVSEPWESLRAGVQNGCPNLRPYLQAEEQWLLDGSAQKTFSNTRR